MCLTLQSTAVCVYNVWRRWLVVHISIHCAHCSSVQNDCFLTAFARSGWKARRVKGLQGGTVAGSLPSLSPPMQPTFHERQVAWEKTSYFFFFSTVSEKAWEQPLPSFRNIVSVCKMKKVGEKMRELDTFLPGPSSMKGRGGGDKVKEFTTSHQIRLR